MSQDKNSMLSEIYLDNRSLMLELKKEIKNSSNLDSKKTLSSFFEEIHDNSMGQMNSKELLIIDQKARINNIKSQSAHLKRYKDLQKTNVRG